jgi:hypothetical protein
MTIGILLCGEIPAMLEAKFGPYSGMIRTLLGPRSATVFDVQKALSHLARKASLAGSCRLSKVLKLLIPSPTGSQVVGSKNG